MSNTEYQKRKEEEEKKKKEKQQEQQKDFKIKIDTKNLLEELAQKISQEFWVDKTKIKELISSKTLSNLEDLKFNINDKENLLNVISWARDVISKASRKEIDLLKWKIDKKEYNPEKDIYISDKFIPKNLMRRARNPKNLWDNLIWASIWLINSSEEIIKVLYNIWAWIIKAPYHIYLIITWKRKYDKFKEI